jgi:hypothetical protein
MKSFEDNYKKWHTNVSFLKSGFRLVGCGLAIFMLDDKTMAILMLAIFFGIAEILGVAEEWI